LEDKPEFYETLAKMAPTKEEELKLKHYSGDLSKIDPAERFLKSVLDVPFAFKRVDAMLYRANFDTEVNYLRKSFGTLEVNCYDVSIFSFDFLQYFLLYKLAGLYMFPRQPFIILSNKFTTPSDHHYLSLVWMYLHTKMCLDTFTLAIGNGGRREY
jgi:hypothetical protein